MYQAIIKMNEYGKQQIPFLFIIDFELKKPVVIRLDEVDSDTIKFNINGFKNYQDPLPLSKTVDFKKYPVDFETYKKAFDIVSNNIHSGNSFLLNLTFQTKIETNLSLEELFLHSQARYKLFFQNEFVVFSPEIFIQIKNNQIASYPMKGTIDASIKNAEQILLEDKKEFAEHATIVDLIRNDLSTIANNVQVEKFRYLDYLKTNQKDLLQVSSKITGELPDNYSETIGNLIVKLLPAGSISGAPKPKTIDIIHQAETYERGYYTGIFGYFDGKDLDSGVMIRFIENKNGELYFKSGGGITAFSEVEKEYTELIDKIYVPIVGSNKSK